MTIRCPITCLAVAVGLVAAVAIAFAGLSALSSAAATPPWRSSSGSGSPTSVSVPSSQEVLSANWAGYTVSGPSTSFSSVSGSWLEPSISCTSPESDVAFWVGLGGASEQSQALEQVGTQAQCNDGGVDQFAWYELVPAAPAKLDLAIHPGDRISARASVNGSSVTVALVDRTTGQSATKTVQVSDADTSSAEWIAEAPSECGQYGDCQPLPLANFTSVTFTDASTTAEGQTGGISDSNWTAQPVELSSSRSGYMFGGAGYRGFGGYGDPLAGAQSRAGAEPSALSANGSSFTVAWVSNSAQEPSSSATGGGPGGSGAGAGGGDGHAGSSGYGGYGPGGYGSAGDHGYGWPGYGSAGSGYAPRGHWRAYGSGGDGPGDYYGGYGPGY